ncbi:MAG TPA: DNA mismatch repair protein MutS [bacterium]|nr:DNA mismatch repair protein MutS [bacterium]HQI48770.1 DNA mismatch repair protein MutS [bacterium]HQJ66119.1 DNA mismatch repair protein MutS [bacterium]
MEQYLAIKNKHKDAVLFFRMGDFYEMFFEDAKTGASVLGITLTSRAHGKAANVPLAGFPHHALDTYLAKMIKAGYRVAICEQTENPKFAKNIVKREVLEVVTPGTAVVDDLLETKRNNYLLGLVVRDQRCGAAAVDVSTGEFQVRELALSALDEYLHALAPAELLISTMPHPALEKILQPLAEVTITRREEWMFLYDFALETLNDQFGTLSLKGFGIEDLPLGICAAGGVLAYLRENQKEKLIHINRVSRAAEEQYMVIDSSTRHNLELVSSFHAARKHGSLLGILDQTRTPMGGRMLVQWITCPLMDLEEITARHDAVEEWTRNSSGRKAVIETLRQSGDLERLLARFVTGRANARDAIAVLNSLQVVATLQAQLQENDAALLAGARAALNPLPELRNEIERALVQDPPLAITEGGFIRSGYNPQLDELREIAFRGKDWIARLQQQERERTGIPSLKVSYTKVFGYFIEVTNPNLSRVPDWYIRKQTLVNAERFITPELKEYEEKVLGAEEKIIELEYELFNQLRRRILDDTMALQENARIIARIDCLSTLAQVAVDYGYVRPVMHGDSSLDIREGRHPVIERLLPAGESFIVNDTHIDTRKEQILIITGPNMAGKSTYLRQVGLIVIMAQMGSFVPATAAEIGVVDRVFTRVGASDNLVAGESTFLTEMNETANILNNATPRSLILLDEIGRGTSTFDGLSIAWSVAEYIHETPRIAAKTIFATHYHELTELELVLPRVKNYNVAVKEWGDRIVFLRKIVPGGCDHSYGIHVAQLAGLPRPVILRAREILANLETVSLDDDKAPQLAHHRRATATPPPQQMSLFAELEKSLREELQRLDPNQLTPLEALNKLEELRQLASDR